MPTANYTVKTTFTAVDMLSAKMYAMSKKVAAFSSKAQAHFARLDMAARKLTRGVSNLMKRFGALGLIVGGSLVVGAIGSVIDKFASFEQANASLSSVMATATRAELQDLQKDAKRLGATTAKSATEVVGLQEAFARLGFQAPAIIDMTESTIAGSIAMKGELSDTAELVGAMVRSFDNLESVNAPSIIDQMTRATQQSALNFEKLQTSLPIVAGAANAAGIPFNKLLALLGKLSDAGIDASSSSTALRNIFIDSAAQGLSYEQILQKIANNQDKLTAANDEFGKRTAVSSVILAKNLTQTDQLSDSLLVGAGAQEAAAKQLDTLKGRLTILNSAWEGFILNIESGNGKFGQFLKTTIEVATEILSLASGTEKAKEELTKAELRVRKFANRAIFFIKVLGGVTAAFVALKVAILANQAVMAAAGFIKFIAIFMKIAKAESLWTAAQWALNIALSANPIGLIIIGIVALIAIIVLLIVKWKEIVNWVKTSDNWFAKFIRNSLIPVINLFRLLRDTWNSIVNAFKAGGIKAGLLQIGKSILNFLLAPIQKLLELIGKIPGVDIADRGAANIALFRESLIAGESGEGNKVTELNTSKTTAAQESLKREERLEKQQVELNLKTDPGVQISGIIPQGVPIIVTNTF